MEKSITISGIAKRNNGWILEENVNLIKNLYKLPGHNINPVDPSITQDLIITGNIYLDDFLRDSCDKIFHTWSANCNGCNSKLNRNLKCSTNH